MRELFGSKNTIGQMASVLKKLQKATFAYISETTVSEIRIVVHGTSVRHSNLAQILCVFYILMYRMR